MKMHLLSGGRLRMRKSIFVPDADRTATIELPVMAALIRHAQGNVLFDTGCHPRAAEDAVGCWGGLAKFMTPIMQPGDNVVAGLAALGLTTDDIDVVVNSHLHTDHCGCNAFFARATFVVHSQEIEAARAATGDMTGYVNTDWDTGGKLDALAGERDLFGDGRIVLLHMPGHTPGSIAGLVELDRSGSMLLAGDTVSLQETLATGVLPRNTWNAEALTRSLADIRRIAKSGAVVIASHDAAQWDMLRKRAHAYD